ncbi:MAG: multidrug effflux MFS transporter [Candidatus Melainabacteria bacterium]|nr:multidrug effflux MFS transporter [Candidatus Melainabacteria bacterium]
MEKGVKLEAKSESPPRRVYGSMNKSSIWFTFFLVGLGVLPPLSIDMGLPALGLIATNLHTTDRASAMTLSLFLLGFAIAPLFCGPLSDRYGRRPVLLFGSAAFALAAAGCTFAPNIEILLACRVIQGLGSGAATVLTTALVRDLFEGHEARARLSQVGAIRSFAPMIAPTIGAWILTMLTWRYIYGLLFVLGTILFFVVNFCFVESAKLNTAPLTVKALWSEYKQVVKHRQSFGFALMNALYFCAVFAYVTNSPLLMMTHFGLTNQQFGYMFAGVSFGIMMGASCSGQLSKRKIPPRVSLYLGFSLAVTAVIANIFLTYSGLASPQTLIPALFAFAFAYGLLSPTAAHGCIEPLPQIAGVVSAVMAFSQMLVGALGGMLVSYFYDESTPWAMVLIMLLFVFASACTYLFVVRPVEHYGSVNKTAA